MAVYILMLPLLTFTFGAAHDASCTQEVAAVDDDLSLLQRTAQLKVEVELLEARATIAEQANKIAEQANKIAEQANNIAKLTKKLDMAQFLCDDKEQAKRLDEEEQEEVKTQDDAAKSLLSTKTSTDIFYQLIKSDSQCVIIDPTFTRILGKRLLYSESVDWHRFVDVQTCANAVAADPVCSQTFHWKPGKGIVHSDCFCLFKGETCRHATVSSGHSIYNIINICAKWSTPGHNEGTYAQTYLPTDAPNGTAWTWQQCAAKCSTNPVCEFWTLQVNGDRFCMMMADKGTFHPNENHIQGPKNGDCEEDCCDAVSLC